MEFLANFTAIDFETANHRRDSACQLAAVVVRDGKIADKRMWMIRPDPFFFSPGNIRIHGIKPADVQREATFGDLWSEIADFVAGDCLIAHNAPFDVGVLMGCLQRHECEIPELHFSCTRLIARETWPDRRRFGLKPLAQWLGVDFRHHDALEDSIACAKVLLAAGIARSAESIEDLEEKLRIVRGKAGPWGVSQAGRRSKRRAKRPAEKTRPGVPRRTLRRGGGLPLPLPINPFDEQAMIREGAGVYRAAAGPTESGGQGPGTSSFEQGQWQRLVVRAEFIQPLRGKCIVFQGRFNSMTSEQLIELTRRGGGQFQQRIDDRTNCLVIGCEMTASTEAVTRSAEMQILSEADFLRLVGYRDPVAPSHP
ncbi:DNA polymerase III subunit epsilon [Roseiconus nitratireducens]|uniref:DNA polymerase III subunit epsilon n=1 Tax=Roseiconus nitratireducens TaxID=2605748 RepID=A0A5M6CXH0_9BACT|nr:exonuclease domain-containing protein [Roseiconus nitratireducens]KAA5539917.1 DNA polymerase III subunit epsilon [Roseiconus nitratireducens]